MSLGFGRADGPSLRGSLAELFGSCRIVDEPGALARLFKFRENPKSAIIDMRCSDWRFFPACANPTDVKK